MTLNMILNLHSYKSVSANSSEPVWVRVRNVPRAAADPPMSCFMVFILDADFKLMPSRGERRRVECVLRQCLMSFYPILSGRVGSGQVRSGREILTVGE